jgi:hypothetical protein
MFTFNRIVLVRILRGKWGTTIMKTHTNFHNTAYLKGKPKFIIPLFISFLAGFLVLMGETGVDNIGYSQTISTNSTNQANFSSQDGEKDLTSVTNDTQSSNTSGILSNSPITPQVKIISHTKGQEVPEGTLTINGVSSDNSDSICDVYVLLNGIRPYQRVTPVGEGGNNDFSLWNFTFLPTYGLITEGDNRMTAKITCITGNTNATKFNSLNVTGIASNRSSPNASTAQTPDSLQSTNENVSDSLSDSNSTSNYTSSQQGPAIKGVIPNGSQANYSGLSPSYTQTNRTTSAQNSSLIQQEEQAAPNSSLAVDGDSEQNSSEQSPEEISDQTKKAVDEFIGRVQGTVEERLQEALKMRVPFELAIPTP